MNFPFDDEIILENSLALLRPINILDVENLYPIAMSDKNLLQYSPTQICTEPFLKKYIENAILDRQNKNRYQFIIFDKIKNKYAGSTSFLNISNYDDRLEIGATWIGKEFQKTGLNRNIKFLMMYFAFEKLNIKRLEFKIDERNTASRTAVEKIGAQYEGLLRSHTLMLNGFRRNTVCYSILNPEWESIKNNFPIKKKIIIFKLNT